MIRVRNFLVPTEPDPGPYAGRGLACLWCGKVLNRLLKHDGMERQAAGTRHCSNACRDLDHSRLRAECGVTMAELDLYFHHQQTGRAGGLASALCRRRKSAKAARHMRLAS